MLNLLAISEDRKVLADVEASAKGLRGIGRVATHRGGLRDQSRLPVDDGFDLLLLDASEHGAAELDAWARMSRSYPRLGVVLLVDGDVPDLLLKALRMGVVEVVRLPVTSDGLQEALGRVRKLAGGDEHIEGRIHVVTSCKGGAGTTSIATNLGHLLATATNARVLLIDLDPQFGDAALQLSERRPAATLADLVEKIGVLDSALLDSSVLNVLPNYAVLAAPEEPGRADGVRPADIEALLRFARAHFDHVVIDAGRGLRPNSVQAMDMADTVLPVLQQTLPYVRDGKRLVEALSSLGYDSSKVRPVINRLDKRAEITPVDIEKALSRRVAAIIPDDYRAVSSAINQGVALVKLQPDNPVSRGIAAIAATLAPATKVAAPASIGSWMSRFLRRA